MRLAPLLLLAGCLLIDQDALQERVDADGDGFVAAAVGGDDCDDDDAAIHPGATEVFYDGIDADCDGESDFDADGDGLEATAFGGTDCDDTLSSIGDDPLDWRADCDGDGAAQARVIVSCGPPTGASGVERASCGDGGSPALWHRDRPTLALDCDDDDPEVHPGRADAPYDGVDANCDGANDFDADGDGVMAAGTPLSEATPSAPATGDCDDTRADVHPGAVDPWYDGTDSDCDGADDFDADGDGWPLGTDCRDTDPTVHPGATEVFYDGIDSDCDGANDFDADGDGFATVGSPVDCDDTDPSVAPGRPDLPYDGIDSDCDGANDFDADGDGWVPALYASEAGGTAPEVGDCDDTASGVSPAAEEVFYDGVDADCDGANDYDRDGDGFVALGFEAVAGGTAPAGGDCDDDDPTRHPGQTEVFYDGIDSDCDGASDFDADGDGVVAGLDCDDADPARAPGLPEVFYDGIDSDCDGASDFDADGDGVPVDLDCDDTDPARRPGQQEVWYDGIDADCDGANDFDVDGDGFVAAAWSGREGGTAPDGGDCDDFAALVHPLAVDLPYDGLDSDCDGTNDFDADGDGVVAEGYRAWAGGTAPHTGDCDDDDPATSPLAIELWYDGQDRDCDGANDYDRDGDGHVADGFEAQAGGTAPATGDCDDGDPGRHASATDFPYDGIDSDCDGADDFDADGDGFVAESFGGDDCDDTDPGVNPGASDGPGIDRDCDGLAVIDLDGDGVEAGQDCDDADPTRWLGPTVAVGLSDALHTLVQAACDDATLVLPAGTLHLTAPVAIDRPLTLQGAGRIEADGHGLVVSADATLAGFTWVGGSSDQGGCVRVASGTLTLDGVTLSECVASGDGGALYVAPGAALLASGSTLERSLAARGGGLYAEAASVQLTESTFVDNEATTGGGLYGADVDATLTGVHFAGDHASSHGGQLYLVQSAVQASDLRLTNGTSAGRGGALALEHVSGRLEDVVVEGTITPSVFNGEQSAVDLRGGDGTLELEHLVINDVTSTAALRITEPRGTLVLHDVEVGFVEGSYGVWAYAESELSTLWIDNLYVHNHSGNTQRAVSLYSLVGERDWRLHNATITRSDAEHTLFVGCHACGTFSVRNVLAGSTAPYGVPSGVMWIDTFGQLDIGYSATLYGRPWWTGYSGPAAFPPVCTACTEETVHPFAAPFPSVDVHLDPGSALWGAGDPALCGGSTEVLCANPGFWGGPNPPRAR